MGEIPAFSNNCRRAGEAEAKIKVGGDKGIINSRNID
jgi:hypothetical protein